MKRITPLGALGRGLVAGAIGAAALPLFFKLTARVAPKSQPAFDPPEREQKSEQPPQTVARRVVEKLMARGPLGQARKETGGQIVQHAFGAAWGGAYGLVRETWPDVPSPLAAAALGLAAYGASSLVILPAFRLAPGPNELTLRHHMYGLVMHLYYAATVWGAYEMARPKMLATLGGIAWALKTRLGLRSKVPKGLQPAAGGLVEALARLRAKDLPDRFRTALADLRD
jgi:hypothetical protein